VVPFRDRAGVSPDGRVRKHRAVRYQASEIAESLRRAVARGSEIAVHGIDAWRDAAAGRKEIDQVIRTTSQSTVGVRMHWLYFSAESPRYLEEAGFDYDSTWGYNDTIGYRAGTSQVFRLQGTLELLELPLVIMDTALFYSDRMGLSPEEARTSCDRILANTRRFGGTLVINWHERSLAPERLWGSFYKELLHRVMKRNRAWMINACTAVEWFRHRRSIRFAVDALGTVAVSAERPFPSTIPPAILRVQRATKKATEACEIPFNGRETVTLEV